MNHIRTYLDDSGWRRQPTSWHDASIWVHDDGHEVLVPARDDMGDTDLRVGEILTVLATVEQRPVDEVAHDVDAPLADVQSYRTFPDSGVPPGFTSLYSGLRALNGVRDVMRAAARSVVEGPRLTFQGGVPARVRDLMQQAQLGSSRPGSYRFNVRVPLDAPAELMSELPMGRLMARQLYDSVVALHMAVENADEDDLTAFEETAVGGVSADLCEALSGLAGRHRLHPFEIGFRWGRGLATDLPAATVGFASGSGKIIHAAAGHLRRSVFSGDAAVTGVVESLHDQPTSNDRWRVKVRGELILRDRTTVVPTVWVRLGERESYDQALVAHRERHRVQARGQVSTVGGRIELVVDGGGLEILG